MQPENIALRLEAQEDSALHDFGADCPIELVEIPSTARRLHALTLRARTCVQKVFPCYDCGRPVVLIRILGSNQLRLVDATEEPMGLWTAPLFVSHDHEVM